MENIDLIVLKRLQTWRASGLRAMLVTVTRTWGSSPRPIGSIMAMAENGQVVGSVSGGCIEDDLIASFTRRDPQTGHTERQMEGLPKTLRYGIKADEAHRFGLPCGGTLELVLEFNPDADQLLELIEQLDQGTLVLRQLDLQTGESALETTQTVQSLKLNEQTLQNCFGPSYRMLLIGAGQLAEYVATMAIFNGFTVTVCDPRQEYAAGWSTTNITQMSDWPDDAVRLFKPDRRTCIVALTHDPKLDDAALMEALETEAFYIGAIGSRANSEARRQRMIEHFDITPESLERLRGPVGLYIGSKTPPEIAVSIMAEILAVKNGVVLSKEQDVAIAKAAQESKNTSEHSA